MKVGKQAGRERGNEFQEARKRTKLLAGKEKEAADHGAM